MDNTTLHTFLFNCPAALRSIVLLGSWDNFARAYPLELDLRRGENFWRGCFTFSDVICDGDPSDLTTKRNGPLKMGGTYWYYYKVDDDDECHNPSQPSTTFCPLLPGQRLNVLELPSDGHSRSNSEPPDNFTRNPSDRYLNPVPPAPLALRDPLRPATPTPESHCMALESPWTSRSATFPRSNALLSPNVVRHARSASASPLMPSTPIFADFKGLKDMITSKRSASRTHSSSKSQELDIGSPVLISSTLGDLKLIPLASYRAPVTSAPRQASPTSTTRSILSIRKEFSPLGSHPVEQVSHAVMGCAELAVEDKMALKRRRSHIPSTVITSEFKLAPGRIRANSADTRRTQHYLFSNAPWASSPTYEGGFEARPRGQSEERPALQVLQRPAAMLKPPSVFERPSSSHSNHSPSNHSPSLRLTPSDKDLPELPRYLQPAPLFACNNADPVELPAEDQLLEHEMEEDDDNEVLRDLMMEYEDQPQSHFSTWSADSMAFSCSTPDHEAVSSPTFSSLTSNCSDDDAPHHLSLRFSYLLQDSESHASDAAEQVTTRIEREPASPPMLDDLRISTFGPDLFNLDIQHADSAPRRQAACFGLGFQYSLPEDEMDSKTTITEKTRQGELSVQRESSMSQFTGLVDEFGYLGEAVI